MSDKGEQSQPPADQKIKLGRRAFVKSAVIGAGLVAGVEISGELVKRAEGIETDHAVFLPVYERHFDNFNPSDIPPNIDAMFFEQITPKGNFLDPISFLRSIQGAYFHRNFPEDVLERLSEDNAYILSGDLNLPGKDVWPTLVAGETLAGAALVKKGLDKDDSPKISRRSILKAASVGAGAWALSPVVQNLVDTGVSVLGLDRKNALERIGVRLNGWNSHLHPENSTVFFRNLKFASNMLTAAEELQLSQEKKPRIAFKVGRQHAGVEDLLIAGSDVCRSLILAYPASFLDATAEMNNPGDLYSVRRIKLPQDYRQGDVAIAEKQGLVTQDKIVDTKLQHLLVERLGHEV